MSNDNNPYEFKPLLNVIRSLSNRSEPLTEEGFGVWWASIPGVLTDEDLAQAKAERETMTPEKWERLQEYAATQRPADFVPLSYEEAKAYGFCIIARAPDKHLP